jgi:hypothetical protein
VWIGADKFEVIQKSKSVKPKVIQSNDGKMEGTFGSKFYGFHHKPEEVIEHLLSVKQGEAIGAIHKNGVGDIDFVCVWGEGVAENDFEGGYGFAKILVKRENDGIDPIRLIGFFSGNNQRRFCWFIKKRP